MSKWALVYRTTEAAEQAALLFKDADVQAESRRLLKLLAQEDNPGHPVNPELDVKYLEHDARNWYRLKIKQHNIRIVFTLLYSKGEQAIEYIYGETIFDDSENLIGINKIGKRTDKFYVETRRLWRKFHK